MIDQNFDTTIKYDYEAMLTACKNYISLLTEIFIIMPNHPSIFS